MQKVVHIEGICYVLVFESNNFSFYVDIDRSTDKTYLIDFADNSEFDDEPPSTLFKDISAKSIFKLKSEIVNFISDVILATKPYFFRYSANEDRKIPVYTAMGAKISRIHGYDMIVDGNVFSFYKTT